MKQRTQASIRSASEPSATTAALLIVAGAVVPVVAAAAFAVALAMSAL